MKTWMKVAIWVILVLVVLYAAGVFDKPLAALKGDKTTATTDTTTDTK
jgi:hypothetical protein